MYSNIDCDANFRSYAIRTAYKDGIGVSHGLEVKGASETANFGIRTHSTR